MHVLRNSSNGKTIANHFNVDEDSCILILNGYDPEYEDIQCPKYVTYHFMVEVIKTFTYEPVLKLWDARNFGRIKFYKDTTLFVFMLEDEYFYM